MGEMLPLGGWVNGSLSRNRRPPDCILSYGCGFGSKFFKCHRCGRAGLAELWDHDAYEGQADLVPAGFKMTLDPKRGRDLIASAVSFASRRYKSEAAI
jgi:hypothetical protein